MRSRRVLVAAIALVAVACDEQHSTSPIITEPPIDTTAVSSTLDSPVDTNAGTTAATTTVATTAPTTTATPTTLPVVTSTVTGTAVAGNSGGVGQDQTDSFSEAVRNEDGTCSGWDGPGDAETWTSGLEVGAPVRILDGTTNQEIGTGSIVSSSFADVDPGDREQWTCTFAYSATVTGTPEVFQLAVANLDPWVARRDPTRPGEFVASVNTVADPAFFSQCTDEDFGDQVTEWSAAGQFWSNGISSVCSNGLHIEALDRPCRPPEIGSDHVISVVRFDDQSVVLEDITGLLVDPATLVPGTPVVVRIATGRPCE
jgi:hypothetical protein